METLQAAVQAVENPQRRSKRARVMTGCMRITVGNETRGKRKVRVAGSADKDSLFSNEGANQSLPRKPVEAANCGLIIKLALEPKVVGANCLRSSPHFVFIFHIFNFTILLHMSSLFAFPPLHFKPSSLPTLFSSTQVGGGEGGGVGLDRESKC